MEGFTDEEIAKAVDHCDNDRVRGMRSHVSVTHGPFMMCRCVRLSGSLCMSFRFEIKTCQQADPFLTALLHLFFV